jgi:hypothetical protein
VPAVIRRSPLTMPLYWPAVELVDASSLGLSGSLMSMVAMPDWSMLVITSRLPTAKVGPTRKPPQVLVGMVLTWTGLAGSAALMMYRPLPDPPTYIYGACQNTHQLPSA